MTNASHSSGPRVKASTRIDKWLWSVRVFKTRSEATKACNGGHVEIDGRNVKPAHNVAVGDRVAVQKGPRRLDLEVVRVIDKRVGAAVAAECYHDHSPPPPARVPYARQAVRDPGAGRPTKKERRQMDRLFGRRR